MEKCHENSNVVSESYHRIKNLLCYNEIPYSGNLENNNNIKVYNKYIILLLIILVLFLIYNTFSYHKGATSLFK